MPCDSSRKESDISKHCYWNHLLNDILVNPYSNSKPGTRLEFGDEQVNICVMC